jgi:hypothetical protein
LEWFFFVGTDKQRKHGETALTADIVGLTCGKVTNKRGFKGFICRDLQNICRDSQNTVLCYRSRLHFLLVV